MELKTKVGIGITFIILFALFVVAAESNVFVDTNFHLKNLYNITNITALYFFGNGSALTGIASVNQSTMNVNSSVYSNLSNFINASGVLNEPWIEASKEGNLNVNYSASCNLSSFINASGVLNNPWVEDNSQDVNLTSNWTNLQNYPVACPGSGANQTFVTTIGDSNTCTAISDIYLLNTGDIGTGNYNFTNNITVSNLGLGGVSPQFPIQYQGAEPSGFSITDYLGGGPAFLYYDTNSTDDVEMVFAMPSDNYFYLEMCNSTQECAQLKYSGEYDEWIIETRSGQNFVFRSDGSMSLTPSAAPASPYEGYIYSNSSDHHMYFYNGTAWKQLD